MGVIKNETNKGDPLGVLAVAGFNSYQDAFNYVLDGFPTDPANANFVDVNLARGDSQPFGSEQYVVFALPSDDGTAFQLLSITQCNPTIPQIVLGSYGSQLTIGR